VAPTQVSDSEELVIPVPSDLSVLSISIRMNGAMGGYCCDYYKQVWSHRKGAPRSAAKRVTTTEKQERKG
jgi:hypothetical protein